MYNLKLILLAAMVAGTALIAWNYVAAVKENKRLSAEILAANATIEKYEKNNKITEEVANEYENTIDKLNADLRRLRAQPVQCHAVTRKAGSADESAAGKKLSGGNGLRSDWLYDYAGRCEGERLKVIGLQNFINEIYKPN